MGHLLYICDKRQPQGEAVKTSNDIIPLMYTACAESGVVGGTYYAPPTTGCLLNTIGMGGDKTNHPAQAEKAAVTGLYYMTHLCTSGSNTLCTLRFK